MAKYTQEDLAGFKPRHSTFVGIDSDGCVFGTMAAKQKNHFHPLIIEKWGLEKIEPQLRAAAEFVNLNSAWRGQNRFPALLQTFQLLKEMPQVAEPKESLPDTTALEAYCNSGLPLGNPSLQEEAGRTDNPELKRVLDWSLAVNRDIDENMESIPPFKWALRSLQRIARNSDAIVVSQTPEEALVKEWRLHDIEQYVEVIAGQELGTKSEHLWMAIDDRYKEGQTLMIGDAPGDMQAAAAVGAWFYPIHPGREDQSWQRLCEEDYDRFLAGEFDGSYQKRLTDEYTACLPKTPPWKEIK